MTEVPRIKRDGEYEREEAWSSSDEFEEGRPRRKGKKGQQQHRPQAGDDDGAGMDPLVRIMMNKEVIEVSSTLIAKLEHIRFDEERDSIFRTEWGSQLFHSLCKRLSPELEDFDVGEWYSGVIVGSERSGAASRTDYRFNAAQCTQAVQTNWLVPLFELEIKAPGFMRIFYNVLELEDKAHSKLASTAKEETEYSDWLNVGAWNPPKPLPAITAGGEQKRPLMIAAKK